MTVEWEINVEFFFTRFLDRWIDLIRFTTEPPSGSFGKKIPSISISSHKKIHCKFNIADGDTKMQKSTVIIGTYGLRRI